MQFITVIDNFLSKELCEYLIDKYSHKTERVLKAYAFNKAVIVNDCRFALKFAREDTDENIKQLIEHLYWTHYDFVSKETGISDATSDDGRSNLYFEDDAFIFQTTKEYDGYHKWHSDGMRDRIMTFILYLNDIEEGGETEFLYQKKRIKPKAGTLVIFPASYTHTHRGNPVLSNQEKHIITGFFNYKIDNHIKKVISPTSYKHNIWDTDE
jgi:predicted 2-oxoglutarate/Fe(II)-dependent dioxygenase YbiX